MAPKAVALLVAAVAFGTLGLAWGDCADNFTGAASRTVLIAVASRSFRFGCARLWRNLDSNAYHVLQLLAT